MLILKDTQWIVRALPLKYFNNEYVSSFTKWYAFYTRTLTNENELSITVVVVVVGKNIYINTAYQKATYKKENYKVAII